MQYQYYDPHPHICRMKQYECCKNYHASCSLYHICKNMNGFSKTSSVCKRDCATCYYSGCSMPLEQRKTDPIYLSGNVVVEPLPLKINFIREQERRLHKISHLENYKLYNIVFGNYREKRNKQQRDRYHADLEFSRQKARERYRAHYVKQEKPIPEAIMPDCKMDCEHCPHDDCVLPEDWRIKANLENWKAENPTYYADYRENNRELLREKSKRYYAENREEILRRQKEHRSKPEIKAQRATYNKEYCKNNPDKIREKQHRYIERNRDKVRERKKAYYEAHKDEINAKRREKYASQKSNEGLTYSKV